MNRTEALRILGLDDDATPEDVKTAYKETVQILHPDRFASNKKLQDRATEQFKNLQEAYDYLTSGKGSRTSARDPRAAAERARSYTSSNQVEARMAGVAAARTQLVKQRDVALDERRNGIAMTAIGGIVALIAGRRPFGLFGIVAAIASAAAVWGIVQVVSSQRTIATLNEHIAELNKEARRLAEEPAVLGRAVVMCVLGGVILVQGHASISFVGVMWGLLGLYKAADEIDEVVHALKGRRPFALKLAFTVFEMVLAVLLIISPFANIEHHVLLLGLELIAYPFRIESGDSGKLTVETEA